MGCLRVDLNRRAVATLGCALGAGNLIFTAGTALFIHEWTHLADHGRLGRAVIVYVLVQFHLATENVVAAWYSSMLLLSVALAALLAFALEKVTVPITREERGQSPFLASKGDSRGWLAWGWVVIAAVFAALSLDEMGSFHERLGMLHRQGKEAAGWVYVLLVPIGAVALFILAFAWSHLRRVPAAAMLFIVGTLLFLSDPVMELVEMALLRAHTGSDMAVHNALLVVEEGIVELGAALCFLLGVLVYIRRTTGDGPHELRLDGTSNALGIATAALLMTAGVPGTHWLVAQLPPGDTGIPDDWFPAAVLYVDALLVVAIHGRRAAAAAVVLTLLSAAFGAGIYGYMGCFQRIGHPGVPLCTGTTALASIGMMAAASATSRRRAPKGAPA